MFASPMIRRARDSAAFSAAATTSSVASLLLLTIVIILVLPSPAVHATKQLVANPGFDLGLSHWVCIGCKSEWKTGQGIDGTPAAKITKRTAKWSRFASQIYVKKHHYYYYTAYVHILRPEAEAKPYYSVEAVVKVINRDGSLNYTAVGINRRIQPDTGFRKVGGDFMVRTASPERNRQSGFTDLRLGINVREFECC